MQLVFAAQARRPEASAIEPPTPGCAVRLAIVARESFVPTKRSRSTSVVMPATVPVLVHCQNVHPWPCQSSAGNGEGSGPHRASQSGYP